jgi:hypothetical protein
MKRVEASATKERWVGRGESQQGAALIRTIGGDRWRTCS